MARISEAAVNALQKTHALRIAEHRAKVWTAAAFKLLQLQPEGAPVDDASYEQSIKSICALTDTPPGLVERALFER